MGEGEEKEEEGESFTANEGVDINESEKAAIAEDDGIPEEMPIKEESGPQRKKNKKNAKKNKGAVPKAEEVAAMEGGIEAEVTTTEEAVIGGDQDAAANEESTEDEWKQIKGKSRWRRR